MTFDVFDVVVVPFPFTDRTTSKRRPAVVLSAANTFNSQIGHCVMAMITSAKNSDWPLDIEIQDLHSAGLASPSVIRMKLFTLDDQLIIRKAGQLEKNDQNNLKTILKKVLKL